MDNLLLNSQLVAQALVALSKDYEIKEQVHGVLKRCSVSSSTFLPNSCH